MRHIAMATENLLYRSAVFLHLTQQPRIEKKKNKAKGHTDFKCFKVIQLP